MFFNKSVLVSLLVIGTSLYAGKRDLIVILDWSEENIANLFNDPIKYDTNLVYFAAASETLFAALMNKVAPIIVSSVTWRNLIEARAIYKDVEELTKKLTQLTVALQST